MLCPVSALFNYLAKLRNDQGLLFRFMDGSPLTKSKFVEKFRTLLSQAGVDSSLYLGHSFCIGAASTAAANGVEDSLIQTLGRWKSSAYLTYVRIPAKNLAAISASICNNNLSFEAYNTIVHLGGYYFVPWGNIWCLRPQLYPPMYIIPADGHSKAIVGLSNAPL